MRSHNYQDFIKFRDQKLTRFKQCYISPGVIKACKTWLPPAPVIFDKKDMRSKDRAFYIIVPWNPWTHKFLQKCIARLNGKWTSYLHKLLGYRVKLQITWKNNGRPLYARLRSTDPMPEEIDMER